MLKKFFKELKKSLPIPYLEITLPQMFFYTYAQIEA